MDALAHLNISLADRYVIDREVGRGGMATVFLARDIKHNRRVALKVLNPELGAVMGVERFLSEIRVTANLQHPNLLPLFDSGEANGLLYYVMPYVEGESLRARLAREKQLPVDEVIHLATAIASALDYAHRHGVIHRDLKPENVLLHDGQPLVADFGIALAVSNAGGERVTQTGLSLGTPQYMSPEQATGDRSIDGRTDIYSLGAITYEMLAGEPPHAGSTAQAIIAKLMTEEPRSLSVLRRSVPPHVDDAVRCALEKLPADRFASAGEFAQALDGGTVSHRTTRGRAAAKRDSRRGLLAVAAVATVGVVILGVLNWRNLATQEPHRTVRFVLDLPADQRIATPEGSSVNLSPDGRTVAYVATTRGSAITRVFVRRIDSLVARALPGCDGGNTPTFSPDGRWVACKTPDDLRKVPLGGGAAEIILAPLYEWQNFTWSAAGDVIVAEKGHLSRVGDKGRRTRFTQPDTAAGEINHAAPIFLDDETVAFWVQKPTSDGTFRGIGVTTRTGGSYDVLDIPGDAPLSYVEGHLLVSNQNGSLTAYPVDLRKRRVTGPAITLEEGIVWIPPGGLQARIARDGSLAYIAGSNGQQLVLLDSSGRTVAQLPEPREYHGGVGGAAISPDGRRVAVGILRQLVGGRHAAYFDTWIWDIDSRSVTRFTTDGGHVPAWTPDGKRIAYLKSTHGYGWGDAWWAPVDGSAPAEPFVKFPAGVRVSSIGFTPSGKSAVVGVIDPATAEDIYQVDVTARDRAPMPLARTPFREMEPRISPDGRWLAYASNETGRFEVYVGPLTPNAARVKVSFGGGRLPQWASGGKRLIYTADNGRTMSARLALSNASVSVAGEDTLLVDGVRRDVDPRTDRILVNRQPSDQRIVVVSKWLDEVKPRMTR